MTTKHDYSADIEPPKEEAFARLDKLIVQMHKHDRRVAELTTALAEETAAAKLHKEKLIPELMESIGLKDATTASGLKVKLKDDITCGLASGDKDPVKRARGLAYLEQEGFHDLIKNKFVIEFDRADEAWANKFEAQMRKRKRQLDYNRTKDVNFQTLSKWARDRLAEGKAVPADDFNFNRRNVAEVTVPKAPK